MRGVNGLELRLVMHYNLWERLVQASRLPVIGRYFGFLLPFLGLDIPRQIKIGPGLRLPHPNGIVVHDRAVIGAHVAIFSGVTVGRADAYRKTGTLFEGIVIEDHVVLGSGCKVLCKEGVLRVRKGTVVGANAVLLESTGEYEVWAGMPARCVGKRDLTGLQIGEWQG